MSNLQSEDLFLLWDWLDILFPRLDTEGFDIQISGSREGRLRQVPFTRDDDDISIHH